MEVQNGKLDFVIVKLSCSENFRAKFSRESLSSNVLKTQV